MPVTAGCANGVCFGALAIAASGVSTDAVLPVCVCTAGVAGIRSGHRVFSAMSRTFSMASAAERVLFP